MSGYTNEGFSEEKPTPADKDNDMDSKSVSTGYGSYADLQSQTELCPNSILKDQLKGHADGGGDLEKNNNPKEEKEYKGIKRYGGMLMTVGASICFSFVTLMVKSLQGFGSDAYGSSFWRYMGVTLPTIPILMFYECGPGGRSRRAKGLKENGKEASIFDTVWPLFENENWKTWIGLFARGITASTSVILRYYALEYLTIGDTSVITYSTPVLVTVMAHFFLGERMSIVPVIITFTTLAGVIIVIKPPLLTGAEGFDTNTLIGTGLALGSLFFSSLIVIITRKIREVHFALMVFVFGTIGIAQSAILAYTLGHGHLDVPTGLSDSLLTGGVAGLSFVGQIAIILALKFEQAGPVSLLRSLDVIFGFLLQFAFLGVVPDLFSAVGGIIVLGGVIIIASRKWIKTMPEGSGIRTWFGWVLR